MPTREEIVEWLLDGVNEIEHAYRHMPKKTKVALGIQQTIDKLKQRAAQVEAMRCDTCRHYDGDYQLCEVIGGSELLIPVYFGCFHHEQKPAG